MSDQTKRASTFTPMIEHPPKRRLGRPRKEEDIGQIINGLSLQLPPSYGVNNSQHFPVDPSDDIASEMVGQVVTSIIEGSFEAGYFISVRAAKTGTLLRGVVFKPGLFTPLTAANDIAPHVRRYKRRDFPIPELNSQPEKNNNQITSDSVPLRDSFSRTATGNLVVGRSTNPNTRRNFKFGLEKESTSPQLKSSYVFPFPKLSHTFTKVPMSTDSLQNKNICALAENKGMLQQKPHFPHQPCSNTIPPTNSSLQKDGFGASTGGRNMIFPLPQYPVWGKDTPQKNSKCALDNKPVSQLKSDPTFPLPTDMLRGNRLSQRNSDPGLLKQSSSKSQLEAPFPLHRRSATVTLPLPFDNKTVSQLKLATAFPLPTDMLRGDRSSRRNSDSGLLKPFSSKSQLESPFPLHRRSATVTLPLIESLLKKNASVSMGGKEIQQQHLKLSLDNGTIPQWDSGTPFASEKVPITDNLPNNNIASSSIEKENPHQNSIFFAFEKPDTEFALGKQSASVTVLPIEKIEAAKITGQHNYGFGRGNVSTPQLESSNRISIWNSIEGKKMGH